MPGPGPDRGRDDPKRESTTPYQGVPHPSRRTLLDGIAGIGGLALASALLDQVSLGSVSAAAPPPDTWPLRRYDAAATASNPDATPPSDPEIDWIDESLAASQTVPVRIVVGPDAVYASAVGTVALERATGSRNWRLDEPGGVLALGDGTLFVGTTALGTLSALGTDGSERWRTDHSDDVQWLLGTDGTLFLGCESGVYAYDAGSGSRRWAADDRWTARVLVSDGRLVATHETVTGYRRRSVLDVPLGSPPGVGWEMGGDSARVAAATDAGIVAGFARDREDGAAEPALLAADHAGEVRWRALDGEGTDPVAVGSLATVGQHGFVSLNRRANDASERHAVASYQLTDGSRRWRQGIDQPVTDLVVVDETVLIGSRPADGSPVRIGSVRALDTTDGSERWRVPVESGCRSLAPVDGTVFAVTTDERVLAIR